MSQKNFSVVFTGELRSGVERDTVISNLMLSLGMREEKAKRLFAGGEVLLKHCATATQAEALADKFFEAGAICAVYDLQDEEHGVEVGGESSLVRILRRFGRSPAKEVSNRSTFGHKHRA